MNEIIREGRRNCRCRGGTGKAVAYRFVRAKVVLSDNDFKGLRKFGEF